MRQFVRCSGVLKMAASGVIESLPCSRTAVAPLGKAPAALLDSDFEHPANS